jgi:hypothetical protein
MWTDFVAEFWSWSQLNGHFSFSPQVAKSHQEKKIAFKLLEPMGTLWLGAFKGHLINYLTNIGSTYQGITIYDIIIR